MLAFYVDLLLTREKIFTVKINLLSARGERRCLSSSCWYFRDNGVHCIGGNGNCWLLYRIDFVNWLLSVGMVDGCHLSHCASSYRYLSSSPSIPSDSVDRRWFGFGLSPVLFLILLFVELGPRTPRQVSVGSCLKKLNPPPKVSAIISGLTFWWHLGWIHEDLLHASTCM